MIRKAEHKDSMQIAEILNPLVKDTLFSYSNREYTKNDIAQELMYKTSVKEPYLVYEANNSILGIITYFPFYFNFNSEFGPENKMKEVTIAVRPEAQKTGVALELNNYLIRYSIENNIHSLWAGCINGNLAGIKFFLKNNYSYITTIPEFKQKFGQYHDLNLFQRIL
jgi:L-amino acid N-acyltransferase YncA